MKPPPEANLESLSLSAAERIDAICVRYEKSWKAGQTPRLEEYLDGVVERITMPFLIVHGENDRQIPLEYALRSYDQAVNAPTRDLRIFTRDESGKRAVFGGSKKFQEDPYWKDHLLFYEYFHGDNGAGLGASHQTGWTGLIASLIDEWRVK